MNSERWVVNVEFLWIASHKAWWGLSSVRETVLCLSLFFFFAMLSSLWDLRSLTRDHTCGSLHWKREALTTRLPGKSQKFYFVLTYKAQVDFRFFFFFTNIPSALGKVDDLQPSSPWAAHTQLCDSFKSWPRTICFSFLDSFALYAYGRNSEHCSFV